MLLLTGYYLVNDLLTDRLLNRKELFLTPEMKLNRTNLFIAISSLALLMVLIIQVNWIFQTARIKEELFNEKANMVLSRTTEDIRTDEATCKKIEECIDANSSTTSSPKLGKDEVEKIDSLFNHYMQLYNFHVDYKFEVQKPKSASTNYGGDFANAFYNEILGNSTTNSGVELKLILPEKRQFIIAEMTTMFITSVLLILVVLILFWRTILSLLHEKKISEHTTDFLNNMTHEFKTPLTNISLAGKMIIKESAVRQDEKIKHYTDIILQENEKLRLQVEQVLSMTALERGEVPLHKEELDFHKLIQDAIKNMHLQIENKQGIIKTDFQAKKFIIFGDRTHLINALSNLIDNAIKFSPDKPDITIQTWNEENYLAILVSDKGIGIEKEYQKFIFNKYFRVPTGNVHDVKGFGLGLAYIKRIVELHAGSVELNSDPGKGTQFTLKFPNG
ncbi:MAG TPA: HAMP domain-containing sensor histidine kinase [Bacteroidia bacterium]|nr:HAMP domain-containing sensor histidine kinase [Bacteroidia bacterium]